MANRYEELFRLPPNLFLEGCPVIIAAGALQKDTVLDRVLAQLKLRNLENKKLIACKVSIRASEPNGEELEGIAVFSYLDQNAGLGEDFGSKTPIYLPDKNTRRISAAVTEVVFDDGSLWRGEACEWQPVPKQEMLAAKLPDEELRDEYVREVEALCGYVPVIRKGLFQCACGTVNLSTAEVCYNCRRSFDFLTEKMNPEYLAARREIRLQREREEREAAERTAAEAAREAAEAEEAARIAAEKARVEKERRAKKIKKAVAIVVAVAAVCAICILILVKVITPKIQLNKAKKLLDVGEYEEAYALLEELGSTDTILASKYERAVEMIDSGDYEEAYVLLDGLNYKDSVELKVLTQKALDYEKAETLYKSEKYEEALTEFINLGDYSDSLERAEYLKSYLDEKYDEELTSAYLAAEKDLSSAGEFLDKIPYRFEPAQELRNIYESYSPYFGDFILTNNTLEEDFHSLFVLIDKAQLMWCAQKTDNSKHLHGIRAIGLETMSEVKDMAVEIHLSGKRHITTHVSFTDGELQITSRTDNSLLSYRGRRK